MYYSLSDSSEISLKHGPSCDQPFTIKIFISRLNGRFKGLRLGR